MVMPGDPVEMTEFQDKAISNSHYVLELTLPNVHMTLPNRSFYEKLYNRWVQHTSWMGWIFCLPAFLPPCSPFAFLALMLSPPQWTLCGAACRTCYVMVCCGHSSFLASVLAAALFVCEIFNSFALVLAGCCLSPTIVTEQMPFCVCSDTKRAGRYLSRGPAVLGWSQNPRVFVSEVSLLKVQSRSLLEWSTLT